MDSPHSILQHYWGFESFRPKQLEIIQSVSLGKDTLALLPTGGGKSICYQVPAMMQQGCCLVVTPLVALMMDQIEGLSQRGIKAMALTGHLPTDRLVELLDNMRYGGYKFLYLSPERLQHDLVCQAIKELDLSLMAIDEAHCISQWGHDFRPAYRSLSKLKELQPNTPILAVTATATPEVVQDVIQQLDLYQPEVFKASFARPNLALNVHKVADKRYHLLQLLQADQWSIIYVRSRNQAVDLADWLCKHGLPATAYHGGIPEKDKMQRQNQWKDGIKPIMVATNAFGMGIDHEQVRQVIHLQLPESLESYYQEVGRAGRDGEPATATLLWNDADKSRAKAQFVDDLPTIEQLKQLYRTLSNYFQISYGEGRFEIFGFNFQRFCDTYNLGRNKTYKALQALDRMGILELSRQFGRKTQVRFLVSSERLLDHFDKRVDHAIVGQMVLRQYGGIFEDSRKISLERVGRQCGLPADRVLEMLQQMQALQLLELDLIETDATITFMVPREDDRTLNPLAKGLQEVNKHKTLQLKAVFNYLDEDISCRSVQLLEYFGEATTKACQICSNCVQPDQSQEQLQTICAAISELLKEAAMDSRSLMEKLTFDPDTCLLALEQMMEAGKVKLKSNNKFYLV